MKMIMTLFAALLCISATASPASGPEKSPQQVYIDQFATLAVEEMYRSGIPASITLAQGLLESRYGLSELAVKGNNHFGIKCHNSWSGKKMYYDDDRRGECFRKYSSPEQSYRDHSDFLRYRDRYKFLFDYKITDYKSWAHGLKKAGYATDPSYAKKLIDIIEKYELHEYDRKPASFARHHRKAEGRTVAKKKERKSERGTKTVVPDVIPESPTVMEQVTVLSEEERAEFHFSISRQTYRQNGVPFVYAEEGDSYESIAASYSLFLKEILKFNDLPSTGYLEPGTVVYLQPKKKQAAKGLEKHVIEGSESMRDISQRYGVRLKNLYKLNGMSSSDVPDQGDIIRLRK